MKARVSIGARSFCIYVYIVRIKKSKVRNRTSLRQLMRLFSLFFPIFFSIYLSHPVSYKAVFFLFHVYMYNIYTYTHILL